MAYCKHLEGLFINAEFDKVLGGFRRIAADFNGVLLVRKSCNDAAGPVVDRVVIERGADLTRGNGITDI